MPETSNDSVLFSTSATSVREFRPNIDDFKEWREVLDSHFVEIAAESDVLKKSILLKAVGMEAYGLLKDLCDPVLPATKTYTQLCTLLERQYSRPVIVFRERRAFFEATRNENEKIVAWFARIKKLARGCKFGSFLDQMIMNKLVMGTYGRTFERLCEEDQDLTLEKALNIAITMEAKVSTCGESEVNFVAKRSVHANNNNSTKCRMKATSNNDSLNKQDGGQRVKCKHCGWKNHSSEQCRFRRSKCNKCQRIGHLASVCRSQSVNLVEKDQVIKSDNYNENNSIFVINNNNSICSVNDATVEPPAPSPFSVEVLVGDVEIRGFIDSGSACSIFPKSIYEQYFKNIKLNQCQVDYRAYGGDKICILGEFQIKVLYKGRVSQLRIVVSNTTSPPIFGRDFMSCFGLVVSEINTVSSLSDLVAGFKNKYSKVFNRDLGTYNVSTVKLQLQPDAKPIFVKPRPIPFAWKSQIEDQLKNLVDKGVLVQVENSEWGTPLVPVLKTDGSLRICGDYKATINKHLCDFKYPLPRIEELVATLKGPYFTKLDLSNAYNQFILDDDSQLICAWSTHVGVFKITRLPFGVKTAAAIFQKEIENILREFPNAINYLDDIVISGASLDEHINNIDQILGKLQKVGLHLNSNKCEFFKKKISYLGFDIDQNGLCKNKDRIAAITEAPIPRNVNEVRAFVGLINYYARFICDFANKISPLYSLLKKNTKFKWSVECQRSYRILKEDITSDQVLAHFDPNLPIILVTDASAVAVAGILSHQLPDGTKHAIAFVSRVLSPAEQNYSTIQREALAIVFCVTKLRFFLLGNKFVLETDHKPLLAIFGENKGLPIMAAARVQRWALTLSGFNYRIQYIKGRENFSDHLSRMPQAPLSEVAEDSSYVNFIKQDKDFVIDFRTVARETEKDVVLSKIKAVVQSGAAHLLVGEEFKSFKGKINEFSVEYGCILWGYRTVIPLKLRNKILSELHKSHLGIVKTKALARSYVWWPCMNDDIEMLISACIPCKKVSPSPQKSSLIPWESCNSVWSRLHIDFAGPLKNFYFLVVIDSYSKWVEIFKTKEITSTFTICKLRELFGRFGLPDTVVSDNGRQFTSEEFREFLKQNQVKQVLTPPGFPASNGQAENFVKTFKKSFLATLLGSNVNNIDVGITRFLFDYRCVAHCTTGESPAKLMFGRELKTRFSRLKPPLIESVISQKQERNVRNFKGGRQVNFEIGENVLIRDYSDPNKVKWQEAKVDKKLGSRTYLCIWKRNLKPIKRHVDQMIKGSDDESPDVQRYTSVLERHQTTEGEVLSQEAEPVETTGRTLRERKNVNYKV